MLKECIKFLNIRPDGVYLDGTLGGGGHAYEIASRLAGGSGRLIVIDKDKEAIAAAKEKLREFGKQITYVHDDFKNFEAQLKKLGISGLEGVLLDLGVSSYQIDTAERGFSYMNDGKLDMRMNRSQKITASDIVNNYKPKDLERIIFDFGEDPNAKLIVAAIVRARHEKPIKTTLELAKIIEESIPAKDRWKLGHPAKRTFQAIRIEVNDELRGLEKAVKRMTQVLYPKGRIVIISFHSLEDRIVKSTLNLMAQECICDKKLPICTCGHKPEITLLTKKPLTPELQEISRNSRAASANLRAAERI